MRAGLASLPVEGWTLSAEPVLRGGIAATHARVVAEEPSGVVRTAADIAALVSPPTCRRGWCRGRWPRSACWPRPRGGCTGCRRSRCTSTRWAASTPSSTWSGTCLALELLGIDELYASAVATGTGTIRAAHGRLPNPPPAVVELLRGAPVYGVDIPLELTTPTGAALLAANVSGWGPLPRLSPLEATGFGAGSRELDGQPNATQVVVGVSAGARSGVGRCRRRASRWSCWRPTSTT